VTVGFSLDDELTVNSQDELAAGWRRPVFQGLRLFSATALKSRAPTQQVPLRLLLAFEDE
jgi:hypothetical protein